MLRQRRHGVDARHRQIAPAEPLTEPIPGRRCHDPAVHVRASIVHERRRRASLLRPRPGEVERRAEHIDHLCAVVLGRRPDIGGHRGSQPHGSFPHRGQPSRVSGGRLVQVDPFQVRERGQPRQHVAELVDQVVAIAGSECARELADLLGEPAERGVPSARGIALHVRGTHRLLEVVDVHGADESNARRVTQLVAQAIAAVVVRDRACLARLHAYIRSSASPMS